MKAVLTAALLIAAIVSLSAQGPPPPPTTAAATLFGGEATAPPPWDAPHLSFEVASVKENKSGQNTAMIRTLPTSFTSTNLPLQTLILQAYRVASYQLVGGPGWVNSDRFDIVAKAPEGSRQDQTMLMLRGLLAERFKLKVRGEKRDTQIYALTLARSDGKLGPKMSKTTDDCAAILAQRREAARAGGPGSLAFTPPGPNEKPVCSMNMRPTPASGGPASMTLRAGGQPLQVLVGRLSAMLNTLVVDRTGLTGLFDFELQYSMQRSLTTQGAATAGGATPVAPIDDGPTVFDAVKELGLKLESERGPVEHLVIESVEQPMPD